MGSTPLTTFPKLSRSFKRCFPFRLSVPSFIYPAGYVENVRLLSPYVDEIELLLFESDESSLPSQWEIEELAALAASQHISYNIHLPIDLDLADSDDRCRQSDAKRLAKAVERVTPLSPTTHVLHLPFNEADTDPRTVAKWVRRNRNSLNEIFAAGNVPPGNFSIETLDYSPFLFEALVAEFDLAVCVDIGHLFRYGYALEAVWRKFGHRTTMVHLHGVFQQKDHLALDRMGAGKRERVKRYLGDYSGGLSLEVFSFDRLTASLSCLAEMFPPDRTDDITF